ncbi:MAG: DNA polymerase III subunit beta, partial [Candidatus Puniceispirillaceae bacterium]
MKLTIDRMSLLRPLGHVQSVVERRNTIPILANVVLRAEEGELSLTATDMDMDIATEVGCSVMTPGTTTMSAHLLYDIARKLPDGAEVEIVVNDGHAMVSTGRSSFRLPTLPVEDFPAISSNELPVNFSFTAADMRDLIDTTRFAISTEETRYYLNGIYIHKADSGELCAVATDGHRLAMTRQALPSGAVQMPSIILPRKAVSELRKLLDDFDGDVFVGLSETRAEFRFGVVRLTSKLIDGTFPDYT